MLLIAIVAVCLAGTLTGYLLGYHVGHKDGVHDERSRRVAWQLSQRAEWNEDA